MQAFQDTWAAACKVEASTMLVPANYVFYVGPISFSGPYCKPNIVFQVKKLNKKKQGKQQRSNRHVKAYLNAPQSTFTRKICFSTKKTITCMCLTKNSEDYSIKNSSILYVLSTISSTFFLK